jgi:hypothetical protein
MFPCFCINIFIHGWFDFSCWTIPTHLHTRTFFICYR